VTCPRDFDKRDARHEACIHRRVAFCPGWQCDICPNFAVHLERPDLARFEEDPDNRPFIWDLEE